MFNLQNVEYFEFPWPHIIIKDFVVKPYSIELLCNNSNLKTYMAQFDEQAARFELREDQLAVATDFPSAIINTLVGMRQSKELISLLEQHFLSHLLELYPQKDKAYFKNYANIRASYGCNSFCNEEVPLKGVHLDSGKKLYTGMVYFKESDDYIEGSNIVLQSYDESGNVIAEKEVQYDSNVALFWPTTYKSWHYVQPRQPSPNNLRRFINYVVDGMEYLHDYSPGSGSDKQYGWKQVKVA